MNRTLTALLGCLLLAAPAAQAQFLYTTNNGTITITGYNGPGGAVIIPASINGLPVTLIGDAAFRERVSLTSVTIPGSVTSIGNGAFFACSRMTSVTIPDSVTTIGQSAFAECYSLTGVMIPDSVASIGEAAFSSCYSLTNVVIPSSVTNIGKGGFGDCGSLMAIAVDAQNLFYSSLNGVLFDNSQATLVQFPGGLGGSYTIPNSANNIEDWAFFYCESLTNVTIGSSVTNIGDYAFDDCQSLASVTIPNSVHSIGVATFYACFSLTSVIIPDSVADIEGGAFGNCWSLASLVIPNSVTNIGDGAFENCHSLTSVTIPDSVASIGDGAFADCGSLTSVFFTGNAPAASTFYEHWAFGGDPATAYYLPNTTGWSNTFAGLPTALWLPQVQTGDGGFGVRSNQFGFNINWANGQTVVVEACTNLANPLWSPVSTNTLTSSSIYFSDPQWTNYPARFYRVRSL